MRYIRWVGLVSSLLFVGVLMTPLPSEADNTTVTFQVDSGNVVTLLDVASGAASTCSTVPAGYTRCYNLINLGLLSTGTSSRSWSLGPYDATAGVDPPPRLLVTDQDSSGMDNITITTLQFDPSPTAYECTNCNTGNGTPGNSLRYGEGHDLKVVVTNTFGITPNRKTVGTVDKYIFALRASGIFKGGGAAGATASGDGVVFEGSGRFGSDTRLTSLLSPFPPSDSTGLALPACDPSNSRLNPAVGGVARTPSSDVNYCTLRRTFGTAVAPTSSYSNVTPTPPLEQVTTNGSPYPSYTCDNGTNCTPTVILNLTARVNGPDTWVLTSSGDAAGGTKHRCSKTDDDMDDRYRLGLHDDDDMDNDVVCKSTKKRIRQYFKKQLRQDLRDPNFVGAESTIACGVCNVSITLFNTGLAAGGSVDPHYSLSSSADPYFPAPGAAIVANPPAGAWVPNTVTSKWISPSANQSQTEEDGGNADGYYIYKTTFDLTGLDPGSASITGQWATDNNGLIKLNGSITGQTTGIEDFGGFTPFSISTGFVSGVNTLEFVVNNIPGPSVNPTGLRVEMSGTATNQSTD